MALKKTFNKDERFGLTQEEVKTGERYLKRHKTFGAVPEAESMKLYEMYMVGCSFQDIHSQYPQYPVGQIILTAALKKWAHDRDKMMSSLRDRVQAKVVKSVIEQVDFLTTMLSVMNAEQLESMRKYVIDPHNNPKPDLRIESIKEYKEVVDTLQKLISGTSSSGRKPTSLSDLLTPSGNTASLNDDKSKEDENTINIKEIAAFEN